MRNEDISLKALLDELILLVVVFSCHDTVEWTLLEHFPNDFKLLPFTISKVIWKW